MPKVTEKLTFFQIIKIRFMVVTWILDKDHHCLDFFLTVIHIYVTLITNDGECPLFTVTVKDHLGNMFIAIRTFLPNQKAYSFKWLLIDLFP